MTSSPTTNSPTPYPQVMKLRMLNVHIKPKFLIRFGGLTQRPVDMSPEKLANLSLAWLIRRKYPQVIKLRMLNVHIKVPDQN